LTALSKDSGRRLIIERLMEPLLIVKGKVLLEIGESRWRRIIVLEVDLLILDRAPEPLNENMVEGSPSAIPANTYVGSL
jgi:hypothetical protein